MRARDGFRLITACVLAGCGLVLAPAAAQAVAPTVTINQAGGQPDPTNGTSVAYSVVFSQSVTGFANGEVSFAGSTVGGALAAAVVGSGANYTVTVTGMSTGGSVVVSVPPGVAQNGMAEGNQASTSIDNTVTVDRTRPSVAVDQALAQVDPTSTSPVHFTASFSEPVTGFGTGDVSLAGSSVGGPLTATVSGTGAVYDIAVSGMTSSGTVVASVLSGEAADAAGNSNLVSTSTDNTVSFTYVPPLVPATPVTPTAPKKKKCKKRKRPATAAKKCRKKRR